MRGAHHEELSNGIVLRFLKIEVSNEDAWFRTQFKFIFNERGAL